MPIIPELITRERRKHGGKAIYLLLIPPLLLTGVFAAALVRPTVLQLGPAVVIVLREGNTGFKSGFHSGPLAGKLGPINGRKYVVTRGRWGGVAVAGGHLLGICWFHGHAK